ncbi:MAG: hypothetical protein V2A71_02075 [Candidatus Eisenbacteria bacterium]
MFKSSQSSLAGLLVLAVLVIYMISQLVTLFVTPVFYIYFDRLEGKRGRILGHRAKRLVGTEEGETRG